MKTVIRGLACGVLSAVWSCAALAIPITFTNFTYATNTLAIAGGNSQSASDNSPPTPLPLLTGVNSNGNGGETASAAAIADTGLLTVQADAFGGSDDGGGSSSISAFSLGASAVANSEFNGDFIAPGGPIAFAFMLTTSGFSNGGATQDSSIRVVVQSGGVTLLDQLFSSAGSYAPILFLPVGTAASVSFIALASADAPGPFDVASQALTANFAVQTVAEPQTLALVIVCALAAAACRRARA